MNVMMENGLCMVPTQRGIRNSHLSALKFVFMLDESPNGCAYVCKDPGVIARSILPSRRLPLSIVAFYCRRPFRPVSAVCDIIYYT